VLRFGVNELELAELEEPLELDDPDDDEELDDEELDEELEDEIDDDDDEEDAELDDELDAPDPVVGAAGESPHAVVKPAAARNVPCERSRRKSRRA
jgi:hypothetical protein